ncbi:MAG: transposase [Anaerolineales bacterium]|nr:transposase [Anaerolineales bacterium]
MPHYQPPGATLFVTFRLAGSLPLHIIQELKEEAERVEVELAKITDKQEQDRKRYDEQRRYFGKFDAFLDCALTGPTWHKDPFIAVQVKNSLHFLENQKYHLDSYTIMPNHAHVVLKPLPKNDQKFFGLSEIMHSLKRFTAHEANKILNRDGPFWQSESYDHVVRDEAEWRRIIRYVVYNPVKAGLVKNWQDWPWTYCPFDV